MKRVRIVTTWVGTGTEDDPNRPAAGDVYEGRWSDVTGQPENDIALGTPGVTIEVVCADATLAAMDTDGVPILWSENASS